MKVNVNRASYNKYEKLLTPTRSYEKNDWLDYISNYLFGSGEESFRKILGQSVDEKNQDHPSSLTNRDGLLWTI